MKILLILNICVLTMRIICTEEMNLSINTNPTDTYSNYDDLVNGKYRIYWNTNEKYLIAEIHCLTDSWVGFGISRNGEMDKSDVVIGGIDSNGIASFTVLISFSKFFIYFDY